MPYWYQLPGAWVGSPGMKTLSTVQIAPREGLVDAIEHLTRSLSRYGCVAWGDGDRLSVTLELEGLVPTQRMSAWRRIVTETLEEIGISVQEYR